MSNALKVTKDLRPYMTCCRVSKILAKSQSSCPLYVHLDTVVRQASGSEPPTPLYDEIEPTLAAVNAAAGSVRAAKHAAYHAPADPHSLYERTGTLVELLGYLRQVACSLGNHVERAESDARKQGLLRRGAVELLTGDLLRSEPARRLPVGVATALRKWTL